MIFDRIFGPGLGGGLVLGGEQNERWAGYDLVVKFDRQPLCGSGGIALRHQCRPAALLCA